MKAPPQTMTCKRCQEREQTWNGDAPTCAFAGKLRDNWNCATLNAIRGICYEGTPRPGVDYQYCEDQKYATIKIDECKLPNGNSIGLALWVTWYKSRGQTEGLWILSDDAPPREPTEEELEAIIAYYANVCMSDGGREMHDLH